MPWTTVQGPDQKFGVDYTEEFFEGKLDSYDIDKVYVGEEEISIEGLYVKDGAKYVCLYDYLYDRLGEELHG
ncbi:MAG: hypothetical protein AB7Q04_13365 [Steroidobacteraceae bacterium]